MRTSSAGGPRRVESLPLVESCSPTTRTASRSALLTRPAPQQTDETSPELARDHSSIIVTTAVFNGADTADATATVADHADQNLAQVPLADL